MMTNHDDNSSPEPPKADQTTLLEVSTTLMDANMATSNASNMLMSGLTDIVGLKAKLERVRVIIEQAHEFLDGADGDILEFLERLASCIHPSETHHVDGHGVVSCRVCGDIWTGLKWASHSDLPETKE